MAYLPPTQWRSEALARVRAYSPFGCPLAVRLPPIAHASTNPLWRVEVSGIAARHSPRHVIDNVQYAWSRLRPQASWSWTKSIDQRAFGLDLTRIGYPRPHGASPEPVACAP